VSIDQNLELDKRIYPSERILVINPLDTDWSLHLTSEIALRAKAAGAEVFWLNATSRSKAKFLLNENDYYPRFRYRSPLRKLERVLKRSGVRSDSTNLKLVKAPIAFNFESVEELRNFKHNDMDFGAIVFSALASRFQTTSFKISEVEEYVDRYFAELFSSYNKIESAIGSFNPQSIITINDRLISSSVAINLGKQKGLQTRVYYFGSSTLRLTEYKNSLYDSNEWRQHIKDNWESQNKIEHRLFKAHQTLDKIAQGPTMDSREFLASQTTGKRMPISKKTLVFYATSEHEHSPNLIRSKGTGFKDQYDAFSTLQDLALGLGFEVIFKHHPIRFSNIARNGDRESTLDWDKVVFSEKTRILPANSDIDTYTLIEDATVNVAWGSTVALESIARTRSTLILGDTHWLDLNWGVHAWSRSEIYQFLSEIPQPLDPTKLIPWFYFLEDFGSPFLFSEMGHGRVKVNGESIFKETFVYKVYSRISRVGLYLNSTLNRS
jgi:hypothetical protein